MDNDWLWVSDRAPAGHLRTHWTPQSSLRQSSGPAYSGVGSSSAEVRMELKRCMPPNSGVSASVLQPTSAMPAATAACRWENSARAEFVRNISSAYLYMLDVQVG